MAQDKTEPGVVGAGLQQVSQPTSAEDQTSTNSANQSKSSTTELRLLLCSTGWSPIPAKGKTTTLAGWPEKITAAPEEITGWEDDYSDHPNTGLVTKTTPSLDVDILHGEAADAVEALVRERFGAHGKVIVRTGRAPKRLIPFRPG